VASEEIERRLVAILMADVAGYSRLIGIDDEGTLAQLNAHHAELIEPKIKEHRGRLVRTTGDGLLVLFVSAVDALRCAVEIQRAMVQRNAQIPPDGRIEFRMGVNVGDIVEGASIHGDGINVAARLEALAEAGGVCVSSRVQEDAKASLGRLGIAFEDLGQHQLKNIDHAVHIYRVLLDHTATTVKPTQAPRAALALPDKPSIAVLPFANLSSDPEQEYLADGIVEDITAELSRFSELFVIARNSSFQYKDKTADVRVVARELGVRYVLEGSVRRAGDQIRISAQLINAETGSYRWAERYDRQLTDVFAIQDEISRTVTSIISVHVNKAEAERILLKPATLWQAHDYYLRAAAAYASHQSSSRIEDINETRRLLEQSLLVDPYYARSYALMAATYLTTYGMRFDEDYYNIATFDRAYALARKAIELDPNLPQARAQWGIALCWNGQHDEAIAEVEKAIALNPNVTDPRFVTILVLAGEHERAIQVAEAHIRLDPFCPPTVAANAGFSHYILKRYEKALRLLRECVSRAPNYRPGRVFLAATYAQLGRLDEARAQVAEVLRIDPHYKIAGRQNRVRIRKRPEDSEHLADGLRKAGLPEK
jgi:adenylate cyclase